MKTLRDYYSTIESGGIFQTYNNYTTNHYSYSIFDDGATDINGMNMALLVRYGNRPIQQWLEDMEPQQDQIASYMHTMFGDKWKKLHDLLELSYNPIENYNMTETLTETHEATTTDSASTSGTSTTSNTVSDESNSTTSQSGTDNKTDSAYGFNSATPVPADKTTSSSSLNITVGVENNNTTSGTTSTTDETTANGTRNETVTHTLNRSGNIGVTTTQQMLQSSIDLLQHQLFQAILADTASLLVLDIY